jgi:hypothetical protein
MLLSSPCICKVLVHGIECLLEGLTVVMQHDELCIKGITDGVHGVDKTRFDCECLVSINED